MDFNIAIVDDETTFRRFLREVLEGQGYCVMEAETGKEATEKIPGFRPHVILLDMVLPDMDGLELLGSWKDREMDCRVVMMTAYGTIKKAIEAIKLGAEDYLTKPFEIEELLLILDRLRDKADLQREIIGLREEIRRHRDKVDYVEGVSPQVRAIYKLIDQVSQSDTATVLIEGESGTGKEVVANLIHSRSKRAEKPFIELNCAAIPDTLLESELFGHEPGAYTDARQGKRGLLELADKGTLFLDEIGDLSPQAQAKLLRFLELRKFRRVGSTQDISIDVRVIAASNRDLEKSAQQGTFRNDLYYRLNVVHLVLPPLRERKEDIPLFANAFLRAPSCALQKAIKGFSLSGMDQLLSYHWPGNIRELKNMIERAVIVCEGDRIETQHLALGDFREGELTQGKADDMDFEIPPEGISLVKKREEIERSLIDKALQMAQGNKSRAAKLLRIPRHILTYQIKKYQIHV